MYVCVCHAIRSRDVKDAAASGACRAAEVFRHMGCRPGCGLCLPTIKSMLSEESGCRGHRGCAAAKAAAQGEAAETKMTVADQGQCQGGHFHHAATLAASEVQEC